MLESTIKYACICLFVIVSRFTQGFQKPNIVFIMADDFGYNDIGYNAIKHQSDMKTPFLDSLALSGVRLDNYYVQPICSPSRSQLMSGMYQIHTGLQHSVISSLQPNGLTLDSILLPEQLKQCGYDTHMIGKWHLGFYKEEYTPWKRGFDTYFGYLTGAEDHFTRLKCEGKKCCGYDLSTETKHINDTYGEYSAHLFARKTGETIKAHNKTNPMFLYVALQSVHSPLQIPYQYAQPFSYIKDNNRRMYGGMVAAMDEAVRNITEHLKSAGMWDNTLLIFSTDNGGQTTRGGNNWPLRGRKATMWEGGVRGVGFVHGKMLNIPNFKDITNKELIHVSDWFPTILSAAQCPIVSGTQKLDGFDQWSTINYLTPSPRKEILHNIDPLYKKHPGTAVRYGFDTTVHAAIRVGDWKLLTGNQGFDGWVKPPEMKFQENKDVEQDVFSTAEFQMTKSKLVQLFNIAKDPYEHFEISHLFPDIVEKLLIKLAKYNERAVPVTYPPIDPAGNPELLRGFWQPWVK